METRLQNRFFTQTTFAMRKPRLKAEFYPDFAFGYPETIPHMIGFVQDNYHFSLIQCTIEALGGKIENTELYSKENSVKDNSIFTRDFCIVLYDKKIMLIPNQERDYIHNAHNILLKLAEENKLEIITVEKSYFEGGNTLYSSEKKLLLHGSNPHGSYLARYPHSTERFYYIPIAETEARLADTLKPYDINVFGVTLDKTTLENKNHHDYFYHLDVFMHLIPDDKSENDRLIILNKKILAPDACNYLEKVFGDNFIDLCYADYLKAPCKLNMVEVEGPKGKHFVCSQLPEQVILELKKHSIHVVTPDMLNSQSAFFDRDLTKKVANRLSTKGFINIEEKSLLSSVPFTTRPFYCDGGKRLPPDFGFRYFISAPKAGFNFEILQGGPHCMTLEIAKQKMSVDLFLDVEKKEDRPYLTYSISHFGYTPLVKPKKKEMEQDEDCCRQAVTYCLINTLGFFNGVVNKLCSSKDNSLKLKNK